VLRVRDCQTLGYHTICWFELSRRLHGLQPSVRSYDALSPAAPLASRQVE
jgi:hypothetical protein